MDVVGGVAIADGTHAKALIGIDDHSRIVRARVMAPERTSAVWRQAWTPWPLARRRRARMARLPHAVNRMEPRPQRIRDPRRRATAGRPAGRHRSFIDNDQDFH